MIGTLRLTRSWSLTADLGLQEDWQHDVTGEPVRYLQPSAGLGVSHSFGGGFEAHAHVGAGVGGALGFLSLPSSVTASVGVTQRF